MQAASIGGVFRMHQNSTYLYTLPMTLVRFRLALEDAEIKHSCLWFVPKSHKNGVGVRMTFTTGEDGACEISKLMVVYLCIV